MLNNSALERQKQRERERKARQRRAANIKHMRETLKSLEASVLAVRTLDDDVWGHYLNGNAMRARHMLLLTKEAHKLVNEHAQLQRLLQEHQLFSTSMSTLLRDRSGYEWDREIERWRELARQHYRPWTVDDCQPVIDAALKEVNAFRWSMDKATTGHRFLGWGDLRRVDRVRGSLQYEFQKAFQGFDMMDYVNTGWDTYTDGETFKEVIIGPRLLGTHEMLQKLTPNLVIMRGTVRFPSIAGNIHRLYLVFRVKTERGFTQCIRSICCPEMMNAIQGVNDVWAWNFLWQQWEQGQDNQGYTFRVGGAMKGIDIEHMCEWMVETFGCVLRSERLATARRLLTNDSIHREVR